MALSPGHPARTVRGVAWDRYRREFRVWRDDIPLPSPPRSRLLTLPWAIVALIGTTVALWFVGVLAIALITWAIEGSEAGTGEGANATVWDHIAIVGAGVGVCAAYLVFGVLHSLWIAARDSP